MFWRSNLWGFECESCSCQGSPDFFYSHFSAWRTVIPLITLAKISNWVLGKWQERDVHARIPRPTVGIFNQLQIYYTSLDWNALPCPIPFCFVAGLCSKKPANAMTWKNGDHIRNCHSHEHSFTVITHLIICILRIPNVVTSDSSCPLNGAAVRKTLIL